MNRPGSRTTYSPVWFNLYDTLSDSKQSFVAFHVIYEEVFDFQYPANFPGW